MAESILMFLDDVEFRCWATEKLTNKRLTKLSSKSTNNLANFEFLSIFPQILRKTATNEHSTILYKKREKSLQSQREGILMKNWFFFHWFSFYPFFTFPFSTPFLPSLFLYEKEKNFTIQIQLFASTTKRWIIFSHLIFSSFTFFNWKTFPLFNGSAAVRLVREGDSLLTAAWGSDECDEGKNRARARLIQLVIIFNHFPIIRTTVATACLV